MGNRTKKFFCLSMIIIIICACGCERKQTEKTSKKQEITLSLWGAKEDEKFLEKVVNSFQKKYNKQANFHITICEEGEKDCKDTVLFDPKGAADVYTFADDQMLDLVKAGALLEIKQDVDEVVEANGGKDSAAIMAASENGKLYAYPATSSNGYFLFYNTSYLTKEDVKSMDGILKAAVKNKKKISMDFTSGWYTYAFFKGAGMDVTLSKDGIRNDCDFNRTDGTYKGTEVAQAMLNIASSKGFISQDDQHFQESIKKGNIIAGISGTWNTETVKKQFGNGYAATKLPTFTINGEQVQMHSVAGFKLVGVNAYTKNPKWAQMLAEWITNEENQKLRFAMRKEAPSNIKAAADEAVQKDVAIAALEEQAKYAHIQKISNAYWSPMYKFGTIMVAGNPEQKDLQKLLDEVTQEIKATPKEEE